MILWPAGTSHLTTITAGDTPCSADVSPLQAVRGQASKRQSSSPVKTPFLQCQLMGSFGSPSTSPSSPRISSVSLTQSKGKVRESLSHASALEPNCEDDGLGSPACSVSPEASTSETHGLQMASPQHVPHISSSRHGQQGLTILSRSQPPDPWQPQLLSQPLPQALEPCRPGVSRLELPEEPATPVLCESPWVDSAGGLAMHGPAHHSSFWRRPTSHDGPARPHSAQASPSIPAASPLDADPAATDSAAGSEEQEQPESEIGPSVRRFQVSRSCNSPSLHALPPCLFSNTPVMEHKKQKPAGLAGEGGVRGALACGDEVLLRDQQMQPPDHPARR